MTEAVIVALVLLSALLHASWNALLRLEPRKDAALIAATVVATAFSLAVAALRWSMGATLFPTFAAAAFSVVAGVFEASYFATLARAMAGGQLGMVYPVSRGGAVLVVWPLSIALFGEVATGPALAGSVVVLAGLALTGGGLRGTGGAAERRALGWALACAASIAGYHLGYKASLAAGANPSTCFALSLVVSVALSLSRLDASARAALGEVARTRTARVVMMGLGCGGSFLILMEALARGGSGFVLTLRNTSVLFAAILAWWIGERPTRLQLAGAGLVAAGAALMAL